MTNSGAAAAWRPLALLSYGLHGNGGSVFSCVFGLGRSHERDDFASSNSSASASAASGFSASGVAERYPFHRASLRLPAPCDAWRAARAGDPRLLSVLACDRHAAALVVEHDGQRRCAGIHRHREGAVDRVPVRARNSGADLSGLFSHRSRGGAAAGLSQCPARPVLLSVRAVRHLSGAALSADPHGVARRAFLDDRLGRELCVARRPVGPARRADARAGPPMGKSIAGALQDAPHRLWRSAWTLRGDRRAVVPARLVAVAARLAVIVSAASAAVHLRGVQGDRMALVGSTASAWARCR